MLFNCCRDNAAPDWSEFDALETGGCTTESDWPRNEHFTNGGEADDVAEFWTVYGHLKSGSVQVVPGQVVRQGTYLADQGHFGLAANDYSHATAPNRRYADLVTQRLVKAAIAGTPAPYTDDELAAIAKQCTDRENAANRVERITRKAAAAILLEHRIGNVFDAIVTGVNKDGTYVRLLSPPAEGRVMRGEKGMDVGERVRVKLVRTDMRKGFIDFERA